LTSSVPCSSEPELLQTVHHHSQIEPTPPYPDELGTNKHRPDLN
jgi:hypothetical protein